MSWIEPPPDFDPHSLAEFIECVLVTAPESFLSITEIRDYFSVGMQPTNEDISFALAEVEGRAAGFGPHYPFLVDDGGVLFEPTGTASLYAFLLFMSTRDSSPARADRNLTSDPLFDVIIREAFKAAAGEMAEALTFAWPPRGGRPGDFPDAVEWAAREMGLEVRDKSEIGTHYKDAGVDVITWLPFNDGRTGFPIVLVQATVQKNFRSKSRDVVPTQWHGWLKIDANPAVGFGIPFSLPARDPWWSDVTREVHLAMDRRRIMNALGRQDPTLWPEWNEIAKFVEVEIAELQSRDKLAAPSSRILRRRKSRRRTGSETSS